MSIHIHRLVVLASQIWSASEKGNPKKGAVDCGGPSNTGRQARCAAFLARCRGGGREEGRGGEGREGERKWEERLGGEREREVEWERGDAKGWDGWREGVRRGGEGGEGGGGGGSGGVEVKGVEEKGSGGRVQGCCH